jgi:hypothetical protein
VGQLKLYYLLASSGCLVAMDQRQGDDEMDPPQCLSGLGRGGKHAKASLHFAPKANSAYIPLCGGMVGIYSTDFQVGRLLCLAKSQVRSRNRGIIEGLYFTRIAAPLAMRLP